MTAGQCYNLILNELKQDFGDDDNCKRFTDMLLNMPAQAYPIIWEEYKDKANMFSLCFIVESVAVMFDTKKGH